MPGTRKTGSNGGTVNSIGRSTPSHPGARRCGLACIPPLLCLLVTSTKTILGFQNDSIDQGTPDGRLASRDRN
ncbi:hypothetical protein PCAR4_900082 [Paraburkholderia caribensis]|nr:hypothetical protein PCAR4_900082 [Paraburkholderia caribensis]